MDEKKKLIYGALRRLKQIISPYCTDSVIWWARKGGKISKKMARSFACGVFKPNQRPGNPLQLAISDSEITPYAIKKLLNPFQNYKPSGVFGLLLCPNLLHLGFQFIISNPKTTSRRILSKNTHIFGYLRHFSHPTSAILDFSHLSSPSENHIEHQYLPISCHIPPKNIHTLEH